jgi:hypothetical protein
MGQKFVKDMCLSVWPFFLFQLRQPILQIIDNIILWNRTVYQPTPFQAGNLSHNVRIATDVHQTLLLIFLAEFNVITWLLCEVYIYFIV